MHLYKNEYVEAEDAFRKAIQLSPNYATAYQWYASLVGNFPLRIQERMELIQKAAELDPRSPVIAVNLGDAYRERGLYSMAERQYLKVIDLDPESTVPYRALASFYLYNTSRNDFALTNALKAHALDPGGVWSLTILLEIYLELGDLESAADVRERLSELDANHPSVGFADVSINMYKNNPAGTRESINWLLPKITGNLFATMNMGAVELMLGDKYRAREIFVLSVPGWLNPDQWEDLISIYDTNGCIFSWILINTGDPELGEQLLKQTTVFLTETLPALDEHADWYAPEICYLTAGDTEKALKSIETYLAHNHLSGWNEFHQLPMYDLIRHEPRYQAALQERERRIEIQREAIKAGGSL